MAKRRKRRTKSTSKGYRWLDRLTVLALFLGLAIATVWLGKDPVEGTAKVVDGDSLELADQRIRLVDIDAPEFTQICNRNGKDYQCGRAARNHLRNLVDNRPVKCTAWDRDKYERLLATCYLEGNEQSLNEMMVRDGWAISYGGYNAQQADARKATRGLWSGKFDTPAEWREIHGGQDQATSNDTLSKIWRWMKSLVGN